MNRKTQAALRLTVQHASAALHLLIADGKIAASDAVAALKRRESMIRELRARLADLEGGVVSTVVQVRKAVTRSMGRKKPKLSAATRAKYRQQGRYLAALRPLSKGARARVKAIRKKSGVVAAIKAASAGAMKKNTARATRANSSRRKMGTKMVAARRQKAPAPAPSAGASPSA